MPDENLKIFSKVQSNSVGWIAVQSLYLPIPAVYLVTTLIAA
jgi:hypothetical protein